MPLVLVPVADSDIPRVVAIQREVYSDNPFNPILFPGPFPPDVFDKQAANMVAAKDADDTTRWLKVIDTDIPGDAGLVAFACWHIYHPKPAPRPAPGLGEGVNLEACGQVFGRIEEMKERIMGGRSYVFLKSLFTVPKHQRRGAAAMLVKWGLDEATRLGLPVYLDSSPAGRALYLKNGFVEVDKSEVDMSRWGLDAVHTTWGMIREVPI